VPAVRVLLRVLADVPHWYVTVLDSVGPNAVEPTTEPFNVALVRVTALAALVVTVGDGWSTKLPVTVVG
jgi:hypothetical protein